MIARTKECISYNGEEGPKMDLGPKGEEEEDDDDEEESEVFLKQMRNIERERSCGQVKGKGARVSNFFYLYGDIME